MAAKAKKTTTTKPRTSKQPIAKPPTEPAKIVLQLPPACPKCGADKLAPIKAGKPFTREIVGEIKGVKYSSVKWQDTACAACGQFVKRRVFLA